VQVPTVLRIYTSPERGAPMVSHDRVLVHQDAGIRFDDRFYVAGGPEVVRTVSAVQDSHRSACTRLRAGAPAAGCRRLSPVARYSTQEKPRETLLVALR
jgi:hypothetical protein